MFLNSITKNRLVFNTIPTIFNDEIMFERSKLAKLHVDLQYFNDSLVDQCSYSTLIPNTEGLTSHLGESINSFDVSNEFCSSSTTTDSSMQTPGYLLANTPKK